MIKLVVSDMDGTLLNDKHQLPSDFFEVEEQLRAKGITFAVASGRQYHNLYETLQPISERLLILSDNGTVVRQGREELFVNPMDQPTANMFIEIVRQVPACFTVLCAKNSAYIEDSDPEFVSTIKFFFKNVNQVDDLTKVKDTLLKVSVCDFNNAATNSYPHFLPYQGDYKVALSSHMWIDITLTHAHKGVALEHIQKHLGIRPEETMVFGDMLNDLEMIQGAHHSYAMKNAHPEIIKAAKFITDLDNNNEGVTKMIRKKLL